MLRALALAAGSLAVFAALATTTTACPGGFGPCECFTCGDAIDLAVFDAEGNPLVDGWTVEATLDGFAVDDLEDCDPGFRFENQCAFGSGTGIYRITIRAAGFATREIAARVAAKSGDDCCTGVCINSTLVNAFLEPAGEP